MRSMFNRVLFSVTQYKFVLSSSTSIALLGTSLVLTYFDIDIILNLSSVVFKRIFVGSAAISVLTWTFLFEHLNRGDIVEITVEMDLGTMFDDVKRMNKRQFIYQVLSFGMIVSSALMIWKGLMVVTGSESPIVVVLSGSMEPAFHRGDLLFLTNYPEEPVRVGEIVVFKVEGRDIPIVHRVLKLHEKNNGTVKFLTKGDNNSVDDRGLYAPGQLWLTKQDVVGRARGFLPYVGMVTILMNEYPKFKYAVLACLGIYVLVHRE